MMFTIKDGRKERKGFENAERIRKRVLHMETRVVGRSTVHTFGVEFNCKIEILRRERDTSLLL
jgi:hypothetical protein